MNDYIDQMKAVFRNKVLNAIGIDRDIKTRMQDSDVEGAIGLMQNHDFEVDEAIREYFPQNHPIMSRPNKERKKLDPYITEKLPRGRQRYINEVELFFLLGNNIKWKLDEGSDRAYGLYTQFLDDTRWNSLIRKAKRIAGAETESSIVWHLENDGGKVRVLPFIAARSTGFKLRTLFTQYGEMQAFAIGYTTKEGDRNIEHWDISTSDYNYFCKRGNVGWSVTTLPNVIGKINAIYFKQPKAWDGVEARCEREEMLDSKHADTNNYFADPIAKASADVINSIPSPETVGQLVQLTGKESVFEYLDPPTNSESRKAEQENLERSILFDSFTPMFDWETLKGLGTMSGVAIDRSMALGHLKRKNRIEIYGEMVDRAKNVMIAILKVLHPEASEELGALRVSFEFARPFEELSETWTAIRDLYDAGLISLETALDFIKTTNAPQEEIDRIRSAKTDEHKMEMELKSPVTPQ